MHFRIKAGQPGQPHEVRELAAKLGLPKPWHSERLSTMVLFFNPWADGEPERDIAASLGSGAPARRDGLTRMQVEILYQQLVEAHRQLLQLSERLDAGEDCLNELLDADDHALMVHRQLKREIASSDAAAIRFLELRGRIPTGGEAA